MATNPYVNKVVYDNQVLVDLTADTVTAGTLKKGETAHDATGAAIVGTMEGGGPQPGDIRWSTTHFDPGDNGADNRQLILKNLEGKPIVLLAYVVNKDIVHTTTKNIDVFAWVNESGRGFTDSNLIDCIVAGNRPGDDHYYYADHVDVTWQNNDHGVTFRTDSSSYGYFAPSGGYDIVYLNDGTWS